MKGMTLKQMARRQRFIAAQVRRQAIEKIASGDLDAKREFVQASLMMHLTRDGLPISARKII